MSVNGYVIRRVVQTPVVLLIISVMIFGVMHLAPGDPVRLALPAGASEELAAKIREQHGLDRPLVVQYLTWLSRVGRLDLGKSIHSGEAVIEMIQDRLPVTLTLATVSAVFSVILATLGIVAAVRFHTAIDYVMLLLVSIGLSIPNFFAGILLILIFGLMMGLLPISGFVSPLADPSGSIRHIAMPAFALGASYAALHARMVRSSMLEILSMDYIRTARAKGLAELWVVLRHTLRNALLPLVTVLAMNYAYMLGGSIIIEQVFALPGIGRLIIDAVNTRDFPVVQGVLLMVSVVFLMINLAADVVYRLIDPRIRY